MKKYLLLLALLLVGSPVMAASKVTAVKPLLLNVDHGINLTLDAPASSVFVANPDIADVQVMSPTSIMLFGKRTGETSFMATDSNGHPLEQRTISVTQDLSGLRQELDLAIPGNKIRVASVPNGLVLTGEAKDAATIADAYKMAQRYIPAGGGGDIINRVQIAGSSQVQIQVRFAEVQRNINNSLGFNWQNLANIGGFTLGLATGNIMNTIASGQQQTAFSTGGAPALFPRPNNSALSQPNDVIGFQRSGGRFNIQGMIDALAQDGLVTILAEPTLTAMSGETAYFLAGGEFPIPVPQGNNTISIQFKNYGVQLAFTPTIIGSNRISLHVKPEVSELSSTGSITIDNIAVPGLLTRRAETTVEVASGQSFAIAGLIDNSQAQTVNKYPLLGDLPVIGALFRSNNFQNGQTELVIIITPYVVTPSAQQLALPTDGLSLPSESDRLLGLRYSNSNPNARPISGDRVGVRDGAPQSLAVPPEPAPVTAVSPSPVSDVTPLPEPAQPPVSQEAMPAMPAALTPEPPAVKTSVNLNPGKVPSGNLSPEALAPSGPGGFILE